MPIALCKMAISGDNVNHSDVQRLQHKRRYKVRCAIRQCNEYAKGVREDEFLDKFIAEYKYLPCLQNSVR